jgi:uncharacterized protein YdaT
MPWTARSAPKTVRGAKKRRQWARIANSELRSGKREGVAKRIASAKMKKLRSKSK